MLDLSNNRIQKITNLENCVQLDTLIISNNRISSLQHVNLALGNVRVLNLQNNLIESTLGLEKLFGLECLDLRGNRFVP